MQTQNLMHINENVQRATRKQAVKEALALELNNSVFVIFGMFQCTIKHVFNCHLTANQHSQRKQTHFRILSAKKTNIYSCSFSLF